VWPAVSSGDAPVAGPGLDAGLLGTSIRTDGSTQLSYAGHPLYYFIKDKGPGTTAGEGITNFGGSWFVVDPTGKKIDKSSSTSGY
jgi:predicted lipoprotein with Yx(FWY)xxD motif